MQPTSSSIPGWGADASFDKRPGFPGERTPPSPLVNIPGYPQRQTLGRPTVHGRGRPLTPVYGTACPPRGISGILRRLAYRAEDYKARRWLLLVIADKIDVIEHNPGRLVVFLGALAVGAIGIRALAARR